MDGALTRAAIDVSGRPFLVWKVEFSTPKVGEMDTQLFREWFQAFAMNAGVTLHVENFYGDNDHHVAESAFKALARALRDAVEIDPRAGDRIPSTKGTLVVSVADCAPNMLRLAQRCVPELGSLPRPDLRRLQEPRQRVKRQWEEFLWIDAVSSRRRSRSVRWPPPLRRPCSASS